MSDCDSSNEQVCEVSNCDSSNSASMLWVPVNLTSKIFCRQVREPRFESYLHQKLIAVLTDGKSNHHK